MRVQVLIVPANGHILPCRNFRRGNPITKPCNEDSVKAEKRPKSGESENWSHLQYSYPQGVQEVPIVGKKHNRNVFGIIYTKSNEDFYWHHFTYFCQNRIPQARASNRTQNHPHQHPTEHIPIETAFGTMIFKLDRITATLTILCFCNDVVKSFNVNSSPPRIARPVTTKACGSVSSTTNLWSSETSSEGELSIYESLAKSFYSDDDLVDNFEGQKSYTNTISLLRVGIPSLFIAASAKISYPFVALALANAINDSGAFAVISQDASQYIQNILTTSGLTFSILVGQTYYFMYQVRSIEVALWIVWFRKYCERKELFGDELSCAIDL